MSATGPLDVAAVVGRLTTAIDVLYELEWAGVAYGPRRGPAIWGGPEEAQRFTACPICGGVNPDVHEERVRRLFLPHAIGHGDGCRLAQALGRTPR